MTSNTKKPTLRNADMYLYGVIVGSVSSRSRSKEDGRFYTYDDTTTTAHARRIV